MKISEEQKKFLEKYVENLDVFIKKDDVNGILDKIDTLIIVKGMTDDQEWLTPFGIELQKLYDEIYHQNS